MVASCLARRGGDHASRFVGGGLTDDPEFRELNKALARRYRDCDKQDAGIPPMLVSGGLAEVILQQSGGTFDDRAKSVDVDRAAKFYGGLDGEVSMDSIAGCDAVYSPGLVQKVLAAPSAGKDEEAALTALYKNTPECGLVAPPPGIPMIYQRAALAAALLLVESRDGFRAGGGMNAASFWLRLWVARDRRAIER